MKTVIKRTWSRDKLRLGLHQAIAPGRKQLSNSVYIISSKTHHGINPHQFLSRPKWFSAISGSDNGAIDLNMMWRFRRAGKRTKSNKVNTQRSPQPSHSDLDVNPAVTFDADYFVCCLKRRCAKPPLARLRISESLLALVGLFGISSRTFCRICGVAQQALCGV